MTTGKAIWLDSTDTEADRNKAEMEAEVLFNRKGEMIKNRHGSLPAKSGISEKTKQELQGALFLKLVEAAVSGPMIDGVDGLGPVAPIENISTIANICADSVDEIFNLIQEKGFVIR